MSQRATQGERGLRESITVPWRELVSASDVDAAVDAIGRYGWSPVAVGLLVHALARGLFQYVSDPFIMMEGYVFRGWPVAAAVTLFEAFFLVAFAWFVYFGAVGVIAGFVSTERIMAPDVFKVGGYLTALFAPAFLVGSAVIATVSAPESVAEITADGPGDIAVQSEAYAAVYDTLQMRIVQTLKAVVWILIGFLMLPVVSRLYAIDEKGSVAAVLPVTLVAVIVAFLV